MHTLEPIVALATAVTTPPISASGRKRTVASGFRSGAMRWLLPDLAMAGAMASIVYLFLLFGGGTALFRDADAGWHIRNGERIISTGLLPHADPYSFSRAGASWVAWEWGADVLSGIAHRTAGLRGVAVLYGLAIGASVWMWFRLNWAAGGNFLLACLFAVPMLSTANLHWLARPHIFSWLFLLGMVWLCERMPARPRRAYFAVYLALIAAGGALWANVHASFFLAPVIALLYAAGAWLRPLVWSGDWGGERNARAGGYLLFGAAASLGSLANPSGWGLHRHVVAYLSDSALLDRIGEFQSFNFHADGAFQIIVTLALGFTGVFASLAVRKPERFLVSLLLTIAALRTARALPLAALLILPLANGSITEALSLARGLASGLRRALDGFLRYGEGLRALDRGFRGFALIPFIAVASFAAVRTAGFPADQFPVAASGAVASLPADARIFSTDKFGGYLIYRFDGQRKVFFDGRSDFYGADFLKAYGRMVQVRPGWQEEFARWNFTHALLPPDFSLVPALETRGWTELYRDGTAVLLAKGQKF